MAKRKMEKKDIERIQFGIDSHGVWYIHGNLSGIDVKATTFSKVISEFAKKKVESVI